MTRTPEALYIDLLKKTLAFTLWPEPPIPIEIFNPGRSRFERLLVSLSSRILASRHLQIAHQRNISPEDREEGLIWPSYAFTMIGHKRLDNIQFCVETALREQIPGDFIETGVWRGGVCILMRGILAAYRIQDRKVFVADSFEGPPRPDSKYPADTGDKHHIWTYLSVSQDEVAGNFAKFGLLDDQVVFLQGWFKDTLPNAPIKELAVLRLDGDMYGSTMDALVNLYPRLAEGGFCIIDDYALKGCRQAVDDFRTQHDIQVELSIIDSTGRYWRKPKIESPFPLPK
jgi:O-methyltransferase